MEKATASRNGIVMLGHIGRNLPNNRNAWSAICHELEAGSPDRGLNMAYAAVTQHARGAGRHRIALRCLSADGVRRQWSFGELEDLSNRYANIFARFGVDRGQVVASLCSRLPALYPAALGALKVGAVYCGLYAAYGPEPVLHRLSAANAVALLTTRRLYAGMRDLRDRLPGLTHVFLLDDSAGTDPTAKHLPALTAQAPDAYKIPATDPESPALLHFTSGTTGMPKAVVHVHAAALHHLLTGRQVLDLKETDVYWCTADPGWVTGVVYGFLAPLMAGAVTIVDEAEYDAQRWLRILSEERVSVWYTSPSAIRRLMTLPLDCCRAYDLKALRLVFSVGEPLSAVAVHWGREALGVPIRDTWWQTETGGIMIANHGSEPVMPGRMGRAVDGVRAAVLKWTGDGRQAEACGCGEIGELALAAGWPSMFRCLPQDREAYRRRFAGPWYLSGDLVRSYPDGSFLFVGRADDMIKTSGHLVSPFEVESVLLEHPDVCEAGVVGAPDDLLGQRVKAWLCLRPGVAADDNLKGRIMAFARQRLGPALAPREIVFAAALPRNPAGKILRMRLGGGM